METERMEKKMKNAFVKEGSDRMEKKLKTEADSQKMNIQSEDDNDIYYGEDSYSYHSSNAHDDDDLDDTASCLGDIVIDEEDLKFDPEIILQGKKVYHTVECGGLSTPEIRVFLEGSEISFPIDQDKPLPKELYDARRRHRVIADPSKEEFDNLVKGRALGQIDLACRDLPEHVQCEIASLALSYFKNMQLGDYEYVRCVKTSAAFSQCFGIHMIFVAHLRGDNSDGKLFSVHLATGDPPKVLDCRILSPIDAQSMRTGRPAFMGERVPLKKKDIACRYCAQEFNQNKNVDFGATI